MHGWAPEVIGAVGAPETTPQGYISVFFAPTDTSREAGQQAAGRIFGARTTDRDEPTTWQTRQAQYDAVCAWGIPNHSLLQRVTAIDRPMFVAHGDWFDVGGFRRDGPIGDHREPFVRGQLERPPSDLVPDGLVHALRITRRRRQQVDHQDMNALPEKLDRFLHESAKCRATALVPR